MLSDRRQRVLAALIEEYVHHALPVGSRTLVENYQLGVSSATVRNELSALEDDGYITQPHTSAGRIPTDFGYRSFVDDLFASEFGDAPVVDDQIRQAVEQARMHAAEIDSLLQQTTAALARLTDCLSIAVPSHTLSLNIGQMSGLSTLLQQPEFSHPQALLPVVKTLEENTVLFEILDATDGQNQTVVRIGHENANELLRGVSVVASQYGFGPSTGVIAVIGPTRMNYAQVISAVQAAREILSNESAPATSTDDEEYKEDTE